MLQYAVLCCNVWPYNEAPCTMLPLVQVDVPVKNMWYLAHEYKSGTHTPISVHAYMYSHTHSVHTHPFACTHTLTRRHARVHAHPRARPIRTGLGIADLSFRFRSWLDAFANSKGVSACVCAPACERAYPCACVRLCACVCVCACGEAPVCIATCYTNATRVARHATVQHGARCRDAGGWSEMGEMSRISIVSFLRKTNPPHVNERGRMMPHGMVSHAARYPTRHGCHSSPHGVPRSTVPPRDAVSPRLRRALCCAAPLVELRAGLPLSGGDGLRVARPQVGEGSSADAPAVRRGGDGSTEASAQVAACRHDPSVQHKRLHAITPGTHQLHLACTVGRTPGMRPAATVPGSTQEYPVAHKSSTRWHTGGRSRSTG